MPKPTKRTKKLAKKGVIASQIEQRRKRQRQQKPKGRKNGGLQPKRVGAEEAKKALQQGGDDEEVEKMDVDEFMTYMEGSDESGDEADGLTVDRPSRGGNGEDSGEDTGEGADGAGDLDGESEEEGDDKFETEDSLRQHKAADAALETVTEHRAQLESLKESDPEFYKYLKETEAELLAFGDGEEEDEAEAAEEGGAAETNAGAGAAAEEESEDDEAGQPTMTAAVLRTLRRDAVEKKTVGGLKRLLVAFRDGCHIGEAAAAAAAAHDGEDAAGSYRPHFIIQSAAVYNKLMVMCLSSLHGVMRHHLGMPSRADLAAKRGLAAAAAGAESPVQPGAGLQERMPLDGPRWRRSQQAARSLVSSLLHLLATAEEPTLTRFALRHLEHYVALFAAFPRSIKRLIRALVERWGSGADDGVRVVAFLRLRQVACELPYPAIEHVLKASYLAYARNAKFYNDATRPTIALLRNCVVELYRLDAATAYQHAFVYVRQLAVSLRAAITKHDAESMKNVYSWQFLNCCRLWADLLSVPATQEGDEAFATALRPLVYPLLQVLEGVARLVPSARHAPVRLHCADMMLRVADANSVYAPVAQLVVEVFSFAEFQRKPAPGAPTPPDLDLALRLSKGSLATRPILDTVATRCIALLTRFFDQLKFSIALPEVAFPVLSELRKFAKRTGVSPWRNAARALVSRVEADATAVAARRAKAEFAPRDTAEMAAFMSDEVKAARAARRAKAEAAEAEARAKEMRAEAEAAEESRVSGAGKRTAAALASAPAEAAAAASGEESEEDDDDDEDSEDAAGQEEDAAAAESESESESESDDESRAKRRRIAQLREGLQKKPKRVKLPRRLAKVQDDVAPLEMSDSE